MKNLIFILFLITPILSLGRSYCYDETKAYSQSKSSARATFKRDPIKYYKRWALMYCVGYTSDERKMHQMPNCKERKETENPDHIDNMVKTCGVEALEELKAYLDKRTTLDYYGKVNACFYVVYESEEFQKKLKMVVEKYCKE